MNEPFGQRPKFETLEDRTLQILQLCIFGALIVVLQTSASNEPNDFYPICGALIVLFVLKLVFFKSVSITDDQFVVKGLFNRFSTPLTSLREVEIGRKGIVRLTFMQPDMTTRKLRVICRGKDPDKAYLWLDNLALMNQANAQSPIQTKSPVRTSS